MKKKSETYMRLFDDDLMMKIFGKLNPTTPERTAKFFELWCEWRPNRIKLKPKTKGYLVKSSLNEMGYKDLFDYQLRGDELRFRTSEDYAMALLSGIKPYIRDMELINV